MLNSKNRNPQKPMLYTDHYYVKRRFMSLRFYDKHKIILVFNFENNKSTYFW